VYYAKPGDLDEMRTALRAHAGRRIPPSDESRQTEWRAIVDSHIGLYDELLS
jgi:hypothetical protein